MTVKERARRFAWKDSKEVRLIAEGESTEEEEDDQTDSRVKGKKIT